MKFIPLILMLGACTTAPNPSIVYQRQNLPYPSIENFPHCRSYGCSKIDMVKLSTAEYETIKTIFTTNTTPSQEKQNIRRAIAAFEKIVGGITGTSADIRGTYVRLGHMQHDCIDESTNTTTYLTLLDTMSLLKFHTVNALTSRPPILSGRLGPHRTAVITETSNGVKFAVDSWFHDNGVKPEIIELKKWKRGWHPEK